jgi:hypothetical protein
MSQRSYLGLNMQIYPINTVRFTPPWYPSANIDIIRRCLLPSSIWSSCCGAELAICYQRSTRKARRGIWRSAYAAHLGNVCLTVLSLTALQLNSNRRLELDWLLPNSKKCESWREGRRLLDRSLRPGGTTSYRHMIEEKTHTFLLKLLETPMHFRDHIVQSVFLFRSVVQTLTTVQFSRKTCHVPRIRVWPER